MRSKYIIKKDENHYIPRDYLRDRCGGFETIKYSTTRAYAANYRGYHFTLFDLSDYGGVFSDWILFCEDTDTYRWLEIKTPEAHKQKEHDMTDGEKWLSGVFGNRFALVVTDDDMEQVMDSCLVTTEGSIA